MRERMITRTIVTSKANALCMDISDIKNPVSDVKEFVIPGFTENTTDTLKFAKEIFETDTLKIVAIVNYEKVETLYGMNESKFIENAVILPPRFGNKDEQ